MYVNITGSLLIFAAITPPSHITSHSVEVVVQVGVETSC